MVRGPMIVDGTAEWLTTKAIAISISDMPAFSARLAERASFVGAIVATGGVALGSMNWLNDGSLVGQSAMLGGSDKRLGRSLHEALAHQA
jgi:hypothetical protein